MDHLSDRIIWSRRSKIPPLVIVLVSEATDSQGGERCIKWMFTGGFGSRAIMMV